MDDTAFRANLALPKIDLSTETLSSSGELGASFSSLSSFHTCDGTDTASECNESTPVLTDCSGDVDDTAESTEALDSDCVILNRDNNDSASGPAFLLRILAIFSYCSSHSKTVTVPNVAGKFRNAIEEFMSGVQGYFKNIFDRELPEDEENYFRQLLLAWNTFLQPVQGVRDTSCILPSDIKDNINKFILWQEEQRVLKISGFCIFPVNMNGEQWTVDYKDWIEEWLPRWNMFLQARAGRTLVTWCNVCFTIGGFTLYIGDIVTDVGTSIYYACNGQWWQAIVTLFIFYYAVFINSERKWRVKEIHYTNAADWLRYVASLLINWPDIKQYWALCRLEWKLHKSPQTNACLVSEWHRRSYNVALLKLMEGVFEARLQAMLQLYLLAPDLYGAWTWTVYLRIASVILSLFSAALSFVNREKYWRILNYIDVPLSAQVLLHVWAVSVTVSRLLSFTLLRIVLPLGALAGLILHLVLYGVYWWRSNGVPRTWNKAFVMYLITLHFIISPFAVVGSVTSRRVSHAIHFLGNAGMTVLWALDTPLVCAHPALYTAIISFNVVIFSVGLWAWQLHENYWPGTYPEYNHKYRILL